MKRKSINELTAQFARVNHFGNYHQGVKALEIVNRYRCNIFAYFGVTWDQGQPIINGRELTTREKAVLYRRKVSTNIYTNNTK